MQITETRVNVTLGGGKAIHTGLRVVQDGVTYKATAECGGNKAGERYRETTAEVTCKKCLKLLAALADKEAAYQDRLEASMMPATEAHDYGYVAPAEAAAEQPAEIIETRENARDAAEDARRDAALLRAAAKLAAEPFRVARPVDADAVCGASLFDVMTSTHGTCALKPGHDRGVINGLEDRLHKTAQMVRDDAHTQALGLQLLVQDSEDIRRDLDAVVTVKNPCTCGHGAHSHGPCYVGPRPLDGGGCDCFIYQPSGLEVVYDAETKCWGVRVQGTQMATWLPFIPTRGGLSRNARADLVRRLLQRNA